MMKFAKIFVTLHLIVFGVLCAMADTSCSGYKPAYPDHYCDCRYNKISQLNTLPFDVEVTDSIWFKSPPKLFLSGFTAYLYSDCDVNFDIYQNCTSHKLLYSVVIPKNQARDVTAETINKKLEEAGMSAMNMTLYICIYPVGGEGGRLMCYPYNTGHNSTCNDILPLLPGMTFVSSHAQDVYEISYENIADSYTMYLQWSGDNGAACRLEVTRGSCDGAVVAEYDFVSGSNLFHFDPALLKDVRAKGEKLYAHFSHDASAVGRITFNEASFEKHLVDTIICQGKEFRYQDFVAAESCVYFYDTVKLSSIKYELYGYNVIFSEPESVYDTLMLRAVDLPYTYRGKQIEEFGDYELIIHTEGQCDERVLLNVHQDFAVVLSDRDTTLCHGKTFSYEGKKYVNNVTFIDSVWNKVYDTLYVNTLNVYFSPADIVYDTLALTKKEVTEGTRYKGITIKAFGDYKKVVYDEYLCVDSLYLHVCHKVTNIVQNVDTALCAGSVYVHSNGAEYTNDVVLVDSLWRGDDTKVVTTTNVHFIVNELAYDTLYLSYSELPYLYKNQVELSHLTDTTVDVLRGQCFGRVQLHLVHKFATIVEEQDTTLCVGKVYGHNGASYTETTTIVDSVWMNMDTFLITTTRVHFVAPEVQYDTLALKSTDLPYNYRGQQIANFGGYDLTIRNTGDCDERVSLNVEHLVTTITTEQDTTLCEGKVYAHNGVSYAETTTIVDSVWMNMDTFLIATTRVHFVAPEVQYDTLALKSTDLPYNYRGQQVVNFGGYDLTIRNTGDCDERISLYVEHLVTTITTEQDTTLCEGKVYEHNGVSYVGTTTIVDSVWMNMDTFLIATMRVHFVVPEVQYDTLALKSTDLPYNYRGQQIANFGGYDLTIRNTGDCDERISLYVEHLTATITTEQDTTLCEGKVYAHNGVSYAETTTIVDSVWMNMDTFLIATTRVHFVAPEVQYDTLALKSTDLPYNYRGQQIANFGDYDLTIRNAGDCDERISLNVEHLVTTITTEQDTTLCEGKVYEHNGVSYVEPAIIVDSLWMNQDTFMIATTNLYFVAPEVEYDTIFVTAAELQAGYYYELADTYIYTEGVYDYEIIVENECTRKISLTVIKEIPSAVDNVSVVTQSKLIMIDGVIYIYHKEEYYTLMGEKVNILKK